MECPKAYERRVYNEEYKRGEDLWSNSYVGVRLIENQDVFNTISAIRKKYCRGVALELGSGAKSNENLLEFCNFLVNSDISRVGLKTAKSAVQNNKTKVDFLVADAEKLPFRYGSFDYIEARAVFHHFPSPETALVVTRDVLRKDGCFCCLEPGLLNPYAMIVRKLFPTRFHTREEKPFIPSVFRGLTKRHFNYVEIFKFNVISYGLSLFLPSTKIAALLMLVDRKLKTTFLSGLCGRFVIIARNSHHSKASEQ